MEHQYTLTQAMIPLMILIIGRGLAAGAADLNQPDRYWFLNMHLHLLQ